MVNQTESQNRSEFLRAYLPTFVGKQISLEELATAFEQQGGEKLSHRTWEREIGQIRYALPGLHVTVSGRSQVLVEPDSDYELEIKRKERPNAKSRLGRAVWNTLFGETVFDNVAVQCADGEQWAALDKRLAEMRSGGTLTIFCDAGSTTEAFVAQLDQIGDLIAPTELTSKRKNSVSARLWPRLRIVTTSLTIAEILCKGRHRNNIEVFVAGGQVWPKYRSVAGLITQRLLPLFGEMFNNCIAIVGATGYRSADGRGGAGLLCSSMEEMFVKDWLVRNSDLCISIFDATKLKMPYLPRVFAPLRAIDLVVTDSGIDETSDKALPQAVAAFCESAKKLEVAVLTV